MGMTTHKGKERIVGEHGRVEEGEQREENCAEEELVEIVVPRVDPVPQHIVPLAYTELEISGMMHLGQGGPERLTAEEVPKRASEAQLLAEHCSGDVVTNI